MQCQTLKQFWRFVPAMAILFSCGATPCQSQDAGEPAGLQLVQSSDSLRVSVLGVTKGVAFLKSPEPVADGGRAEGSHPVEWMQVKVLVEMLGEVNSIGVYKSELVTPDGQPFATPKLVDGAGTVMASSTIESDLTGDLRLPTMLYPSRVPQLKDATRGKVFVFGVSGELHTGKAIRLELSFSGKKGEASGEFVFDLPVP
jgi:hypothetical protein